jgi:hypothetical protein
MLEQHASPHRDFLRLTEKQAMQIGEPLRTIVVEPLDLPVKESQNRPELIAPEPDPEGEPATK